MSELIKILNDIADDKKNSLGDYWSISYVGDAANKLQQQAARIDKLEKIISDSIIQFETSESPFYEGIKILKGIKNEQI